MTQEAFPIRPDFVVNATAQMIRLKQEGHSYSYIAKVVKQVAKKHVGKERKFLLDEAKRLEQLERKEIKV